MTNFVKIERIVSFDGASKTVRVSAYANKAPMTRLCTADMDATEPIDGGLSSGSDRRFPEGQIPHVTTPRKGLFRDRIPK